jgi:Ran GTPase-activating protein (RanGAP) involved in mRNA processing and transport
MNTYEFDIVSYRVQNLLPQISNINFKTTFLSLGLNRFFNNLAMLAEALASCEERWVSFTWPLRAISLTK